MIHRINRAIRVLTAGSKPDIERTQIDAEAVQEAFGELSGFGGPVRRQPLDTQYWTTDKGTLERIVDRDPTDLTIWTPDDHDCDEFARALFAMLPTVFGINAVGFVNDSGAQHAYNCVVDAQGRLWFVEPDSDGWGFRRGSEFPVDGRHQLERATILF